MPRENGGDLLLVKAVAQQIPDDLASRIEHHQPVHLRLTQHPALTELKCEHLHWAHQASNSAICRRLR